MNTCSYIDMHTISKNKLIQGVTASKILSSEARFKILYLLLQKGGHDVCVKEIAQAVGLTHSATSHQLARLQAQGIVTPSRRGQTMCYDINNSPLAKQLTTIIKSIKKN